MTQKNGKQQARVYISVLEDKVRFIPELVPCQSMGQNVRQ